TFANRKSIFRITNKQTSPHILTGEIRTHIELTRSAWRRNWLGNPEKFQLIAEFRITAPANKQRRMSRPSLSFELNRFELEQKTRESVRRHLWLRSHEANRVHYARPIAEINRQLQAGCIGDPKIVQQKESAPNQQICRC